MSSLDRGRIVVTGGAGFIGSALVWALNQRGYDDIVIVDYLAPGKGWHGEVALATGRESKLRNLTPLRFTELLEADDLRQRLQRRPDTLGKIGTVFHLGACSSTTEQNERFLHDNNFAFSCEMADWALAVGARFIYASSAATYGDGTASMDDRDPNLERLRPLNPYATSKQQFDLHASRNGLLGRIVGLKYFNVFGPNEDHKGEMRSVVHKAYHQIRATGTVKLFRSYRPEYADGAQERDFLYVKDAVAMTLHFAETAPAAHGIFNIGSGVAHPWLALAGALFDAMGLEARIEFIDMPSELRARYQYFTRADVAKLRATGFDGTITPLDAAVREYVHSYLLPDKRLGE